ncbi:hypothetical protein JCM1840_001649 [Sporobolomyces johnsonii]
MYALPDIMANRGLALGPFQIPRMEAARKVCVPFPDALLYLLFAAIVEDSESRSDSQIRPQAKVWHLLLLVLMAADDELYLESSGARPIIAYPPLHQFYRALPGDDHEHADKATKRTWDALVRQTSHPLSEQRANELARWHLAQPGTAAGESIERSLSVVTKWYRTSWDLARWYMKVATFFSVEIL